MFRFKFVLFLLPLALISPALAGSGPGGAGNFGLGVMAGAPTGFTGKYWFDQRRAFQAGIGWDLDDDADFTADYLIHTRNAFSRSAPDLGPLGYYVGFGARARSDNDEALAVRGVGGLSWLFDTHPFEIFVELAPTLVLVEDTDGDIDGGLGVRYYFK